MVRCCQCKVWYCSPQCQEDHWPHHYFLCTPPPPLEWPNLLVVESSSDTPSLTELKMETKKKAEVEVVALEESIEEKLANEDSVLDISADIKKKTMKKVDILVVTASLTTNLSRFSNRSLPDPSVAARSSPWSSPACEGHAI